jgi:alpha,alpha-trehalose-phosphate synthase [UDP-forming]
MTGFEDKRLIVVSNRLPIVLTREAGKVSIRQGAGGLVTALAPVLKNRGGMWIGWPGVFGKEEMRIFEKFSREAGYIIQPVDLSEQDVKGFYQGFSNEILWPLFHEFQMPCNFLPAYWDAYRAVNRSFAEAVAGQSTPGDMVWVHDYHLMLLARRIKAMGEERRMGFFLHIPFPPVDIFLKLPWRKEIVDSLLDYELIGFQTIRDRRNFFETVKRLYPEASKRGRGQVVQLAAGGRKLRIGSFPISIDFGLYARTAAAPEIRAKAEELRSAFKDRFIVFGADRLDYTKGIPQRLDAFGKALELYPEMRGRVCLIQVLVPSREDVPQYQAMKEEIERMVGQLNGRYAIPGWTPVHYVYRNLLRDELIGYYLAADMAMVTPLRDGMNLVAKEYVACNQSEKGILCLSEFAGSAMEFHRYALMVNPFNVEEVARAIKDGTEMGEAARRRRMRRMRDIVRRYDIFWWVDTFLMAAFSKHLNDFPQRDDFAAVWDGPHGPPWASL